MNGELPAIAGARRLVVAGIGTRLTASPAPALAAA